MCFFDSQTNIVYFATLYMKVGIQKRKRVR